MTFRQAIHQAIRESELTFLERRKLNIALRLPGSRKKIEEKILSEAIIAEVVYSTLTLDSETQLDIDWDKVKEFIKTYLPILITILITILL